MNKKLSDYVVYVSDDAYLSGLDRLIEKCKFVAAWISLNVNRTDKSVSVVNIINSIISFIEISKHSNSLHISVLALSTRNQYELNVRLRTLFDSELDQKSWVSEAITDQIQVLDGIISLSENSDEFTQQVTSLKQEIKRLEDLRIKYKLPSIKQSESTGNLAKKAGLEREHKGLYKLFSKLIHPSSFLINNYELASASIFRETLQTHSQIYVLDAIERIEKEFNIPKNGIH